MIEIILLVVFGLALKKVAEQKGRPATWALAALAIPAVGWTASFIAGVVIAANTGASNLADTPYFWPVLGGVILLELAVGVAVYFFVKGLKPLTAAQPSIPAPPPTVEP